VAGNQPIDLGHLVGSRYERDQQLDLSFVCHPSTSGSVVSMSEVVQLVTRWAADLHRSLLECTPSVEDGASQVHRWTPGGLSRFRALRTEGGI
jgi:hypothetical protein